MIRAYIIGPYRAATREGISANIARARALAERLWAAGYAVFCPHLNSAHMDGVAPDHWFLDGDMEWLQYAQIAFVLEGWEASEGSKAEIRECERLGIPVLYMRGEEVSL